MNFAKKTMSAILATVMAASSLFVGTTAFAAAPAFTPTTGQAQTFTRQANVVKTTEKPSEYKGNYSDYYTYYNSAEDKVVYCYYDNSTYYSFTPAVTGTYAITVDDSVRMYANVAITKEYDEWDDEYYNSYKYTYSNTPDATAAYSYVYNTQVSLYEEVSDVLNDEAYCYVSSDQYASAYHYVEANDTIYPNIDTINYVKGYQTVDLIGGKTYYIEAYAPSNYEYPKDYTGEPTMTWTDTVGSFSIEKVDWNGYIHRDNDKVAKVKVSIPDSVTDSSVWVNDNNYAYSEDSYSNDLEVKKDASGAKYVEVNVNPYPVASVSYNGAATDVIVPETVNGCVVESVDGTRNKSIKSLTLSSGVKYVSGFSGLDKLETVTFNNVVERIGSFENDTALKAIAIPGTVKNIESDAFYGCSALATAIIGDGVKNIGSYAFYNTALKGVVLPASVKSIGNMAFGYVRNLDVDTVAPYDLTNVKVDGFTLGSVNNANVAKYAAQNGFAYCDVASGCPHPYVVTTVPATLFAAGSTTTACPLCGATATKTIKKKTFKISSLKAAKKALTVKAAKQADIAGYIVDYSTSKKFTKKTTKSVKVNSTGALKKKITGLKSGKKYYVRVRAFNVVEGKTVYSKYTAVKSVKVK